MIFSLPCPSLCVFDWAKSAESVSDGIPLQSEHSQYNYADDILT